jgi:hypothetical protein
MVAVDEALVDTRPDRWVAVAWAVSDARCAVPEGRCALVPHPAASTTTAIAVTPAARMR